MLELAASALGVDSHSPLEGHGTAQSKAGVIRPDKRQRRYEIRFAMCNVRCRMQFNHVYSRHRRRQPNRLSSLLPSFVLLCTAQNFATLPFASSYVPTTQLTLHNLSRNSITSTLSSHVASCLVDVHVPRARRARHARQALLATVAGRVYFGGLPFDLSSTICCAQQVEVYSGFYPLPYHAICNVLYSLHRRNSTVTFGLH